ncbi:MAG: DUF3842 family protein [Nitrospira sp.]|jgi:hypothetical protein|uniref:DUF3842 family protein n=1 Tax=Candidatus Nitrospira nitrosa TaxID=1742972 RepID=A0A0S4L9M6_9BACT|nr:DUF3842 family protein [Candidatus Nitrospira nitrosa]MBK8278068.1 DUF3842 family protein [Nitrospira sp.]MBK9947539.1 DUF3842 family protein [Nitrospira sp.]CUS34407.1 conserved hypothetical protein [Candidatus Nitrospira nitrosa]
MRVCVIDGRGGGLGSRLVAGLRATLGVNCQILGLGTNLAAAEAMREAGAEPVASGVDAISKTVPTVDVIVASLNMILPGAMLGEVTSEVSKTILEAKAKKVLLPLNRVQIEIVGTEGRTMDVLIDECLSRVRIAVRATGQA